MKFVLCRGPTRGWQVHTRERHGRIDHRSTIRARWCTVVILNRKRLSAGNAAGFDFLNFQFFFKAWGPNQTVGPFCSFLPHPPTTPTESVKSSACELQSMATACRAASARNSQRPSFKSRYRMVDGARRSSCGIFPAQFRCSFFWPRLELSHFMFPLQPRGNSLCTHLTSPYFRSRSATMAHRPATSTRPLHRVLPWFGLCTKREEDGCSMLRPPSGATST
jgi:hypothetical protein